MKMPSKKTIILAFVVGILFYLGLYFYAVNSDAYLSAKQEILSSDALISKVGEVQSIELPIFGRFKLHWEGIGDESTATAKFKVKVKGSLKSLDLIIRSEMNNKIWKIQSIEHDGQNLWGQKHKLKQRKTGTVY